LKTIPIVIELDEPIVFLFFLIPSAVRLTARPWFGRRYTMKNKINWFHFYSWYIIIFYYINNVFFNLKLNLRKFYAWFIIIKDNIFLNHDEFF